MRCLNCKEKFTPKKFLAKFCDSDECKVAERKYQIEKQKAQKKHRKSTDKVQLPSIRKTSSIKPKEVLQMEINRIVKILDYGHGCTAKPHTKSIRIEAGHVISRGSNETLRYHLLNVWAESHENNQHSQDSTALKDGLVRLYGTAFLSELEALKSTPPLKLTSHEIEEKIFICRGIIKYLQLQDKRFSINERLSLRRRFNSEIGLYK